MIKNKLDMFEIKKLISIANNLDNRGLYKEADIIDNLLFKYATDPAAPAGQQKPLLKKGSRGEWVTYLQNKLNQIQNAGLQVDGIFGSNTYAAVIAFQKAKGLTQDGIVGPNTHAALDQATPAATTTTTTPAATTPAPVETRTVAIPGSDRTTSVDVYNTRRDAVQADASGASRSFSRANELEQRLEANPQFSAQRQGRLGRRIERVEDRGERRAIRGAT